MKQITIDDTKSLKLRLQQSSFVQPENSGVKESFLSYFYSLQIHFPSKNSKKVLLNIKLYIFIIHIGGQRKTIMNSGQHHRTHHLIPGNVCKKRMLKYKIIFIKFPFKKSHSILIQLQRYNGDRICFLKHPIYQLEGYSGNSNNFDQNVRAENQKLKLTVCSMKVVPENS